MPAGRKRDLIVIERFATVPDEYNEPVPTWNFLGEEWAEIHFGRGDERRQAAMEQGKQPATFVVWDNSLTRSVTVQDRISFDQGAWDVRQNSPGKPGDREITAVRAT